MDNKRVKMTLLLDSETVKLLKQYSYEKYEETNASRAVMSMAKEYGKQKQQKENS